jgi:Domain of unknown function (DUF5679)
VVARSDTNQYIIPYWSLLVLLPGNCRHGCAKILFSSQARTGRNDSVEARTGSATLSTKGGNEVEGYCVKCRAKKEIKNAKEITMKNGRPATEGQCPDCGTKIFKIGKAS